VILPTVLASYNLDPSISRGRRSLSRHVIAEAAGMQSKMRAGGGSASYYIV
jgi:hypothetical protein